MNNGAFGPRLSFVHGCVLCACCRRNPTPPSALSPKAMRKNELGSGTFSWLITMAATPPDGEAVFTTRAPGGRYADSPKAMVCSMLGETASEEAYKSPVVTRPRMVSVLSVDSETVGASSSRPASSSRLPTAWMSMERSACNSPGPMRRSWRQSMRVAGPKVTDRSPEQCIEGAAACAETAPTNKASDVAQPIRCLVFKSFSQNVERLYVCSVSRGADFQKV